MTLLDLETLNLQMENKTIKYVKKQRSHYGTAGGAMQEYTIKYVTRPPNAESRPQIIINH